MKRLTGSHSEGAPVLEVTAQEDQVGQVATTVIDTDVHNFAVPDVLMPYLPKRWASYFATYGPRSVGEVGLVRARSMASRSDAWPDSGGVPGGDPAFAASHHLDTWGIDRAILNNMAGNAHFAVGGHQPHDLSIATMRAANDWTQEQWLDADARWLSSICLPFEYPDAAVAEMARRCEGVDARRWVQGLLCDRTEKPIGNRKYWPMWEAAAHYDIPLGFHPGGMGSNAITASGWPSYYYEDHVGYPQAAFSQIASLIFEGVFDRWPNLKIVVIEGGYSWAVPFGWRLDAAWRVLKEETPDLQRKPSEYLERVWFTTQPIEEPERPEWFAGLWSQLCNAGLGDNLMYSSDYPHWDFDPPVEAVPESVLEVDRRRIFAQNASALYGLSLPVVAR